ncbi:MAG: DUF2958 domain-containing protein [Muribaculaceae bacterium]|nr:DUF2958 domain-containing protein [Muribaculaceae bacterium]
MSRLMTTQLEEAFKDAPLYSQDGKGKDAICNAVFAIGSARWYMTEGEREENDFTMFGIVIGLLEDEYGYVSLNELSGIELDLTSKGLGKHRIIQLENFKPRPLKEIDDIRLKHFLARFED